MTYTYYGHSCFALEIGDYRILFDPFISGNELAKHIDIAAIKCTHIFVSHGHEDHIADCVSIAKANNALVICSWEISVWLNKQGLNTHPMNTGGNWLFEFGRLRCVAAEHSSGLPDGSYGGNAMGCIIYTEKGDLYYTGDTALTMDMQLIPKFADVKTVICCIGDNFTMGIDDAIACMEMVDCDLAIGVHYDTFGYIVIDKPLAISAFDAKDIKLLLPEIGSTLECNI
jgi:L-ascorbate metabolism protein UlaG (beta-lactamase superfamily)